MFERAWHRVGRGQLALVLLSLLPVAALAQVRFNLPAESLSQALKELATQADLNIYYDPAAIAGLRAKAVQADLTPKAALERLLAGSKFVAVYVDQDTVRVESKEELDRLRKASAGNRRASTSDDPPERVTPGGASDPGYDANAALLEREALQTIVVTAQRYAQNPRDVPISMSVMSGEQLEQLHITTLTDLKYVVPSLEDQNIGAVDYLMIRGVGNVFGSGATVGEYIDEADVSPSAFIFNISMPTIETYDLSRVEVLRGPQGTLFGAGSVGGTVRFITNQPDLASLNGYADLRDSISQDGAPSQRIVSVLNTPIDQNVLGVRIASDFDHEGGYLDQPALGLKNYNDTNTIDARIQAKWVPAEGLTVNLMEILHRSAMGYDAGTNEQGIYTQVFNLSTNPNGDEHYDVSNMDIKYDVAQVEVLSATTYLSRDIGFSNLGTREPVNGPAAVTTPYDQLFNPELDSLKTLTEDLRVTNRGSDVWHWTVGAFYDHDSDHFSYQDYIALPAPVGTPLPTPLVTDQRLVSRSLSLYGDVNGKVLPRLTVGAGVRYFSDHQNFTDFDPTGAVGEPGPAAYQTARFVSTDPRAYALFKVSSDINVYVEAAKGFRSGGFNSLGLPQYQPEEVWSYEVGTKTRFFDDRLTINVDGFLADYSKYVTLIFNPAVATDIYANAGVVRVKGGEGTVAWVPAKGWVVRLGADYLNGRYVEVTGESPPNNVGDPIMIAPRYQFSLLVRRNFLVDGRVGFAELDYSQRARSNIRFRNVGPWFYGQSDYLYQLGANLGLYITKRAQLDVFASNLLNQHAYTSADVVEMESAITRPRTVGIDVNVTL